MTMNEAIEAAFERLSAFLAVHGNSGREEREDAIRVFHDALGLNTVTWAAFVEELLDFGVTPAQMDEFFPVVSLGLVIGLLARQRQDEQEAHRWAA
jgi:hypothetical protein